MQITQLLFTAGFKEFVLVYLWIKSSIGGKEFIDDEDVKSPAKVETFLLNRVSVNMNYPEQLL